MLWPRGVIISKLYQLSTRLFARSINGCFWALHQATALQNYSLPLIIGMCKSPYAGDLHVCIQILSTHHVIPLLRYKGAILFHSFINLYFDNNVFLLTQPYLPLQPNMVAVRV